jgi:hypothetical protein
MGKYITEEDGIVYNKKFANQRLRNQWFFLSYNFVYCETSGKIKADFNNKT